MSFKIVISFLALLYPLVSVSAPTNFSDSKVELRRYVYHDQNSKGTLYCGCKWSWAGASGGRVNLNSCGYQVRADSNRANRIEWEHIVPASNFGRARQCWQKGGRSYCQKTDPTFNTMEADMHNLAPSIGEVNADRSNFNFGQLSGNANQYGACDFKVDFKQRTAEPRDEVKGRIARVYFYMADRYKMPLSRQQQQLFAAWNKAHPVTPEELLIDSRIAERMGHHNPFVTGDKQWGSNSSHQAHYPAQNASMAVPKVSRSVATGGITSGGAGGAVQIHGNKRSHIYHLSKGCPDFQRLSSTNVVQFPDEASAVAAGYRKARNCQ